MLPHLFGSRRLADLVYDGRMCPQRIHGGLQQLLPAGDWISGRRVPAKNHEGVGAGYQKVQRPVCSIGRLCRKADTKGCGQHGTSAGSTGGCCYDRLPRGSGRRRGRPGRRRDSCYGNKRLLSAEFTYRRGNTWNLQLYI